MRINNTIALVLAVTLTLSSTAIAQDELNEDREVVERETTAQTMSEQVYKRVSAIHELMGEGQNAEALERSRELEKNTRLNNYERALIYQTIGFIFANQSKTDQAIEYFEKSIAENALSPAAQQGMLYSLASLYGSEGKYRKSIATAREWFKYEADPSPDAYMLIGSNFAQLNEYKNALPYVLKAIEKSEKPREPWYQLSLAIYFETQQVPKAIPVLQKMIQYWPDKQTYWETLYGAHMQLEQDQQALSTLMVAYRRGLLTEESKILNLVRMNMFLEIPYTAGTILEENLASGVVTRNKEHLELLQSAWTSAQEYPRALEVMSELGKMTGDPTYAIEQAKIYNELAEWDNVISAARTALDRGYDKPGEANLLLGTAYSELGQFRESLAAFEQAAKLGTSQERSNARAWIGFVTDRMKIEGTPVASR
ncbi:MAG: hypothetical protein AAF270_01800 [Pseudomonadota bacterium]